MVVSPNTNGLKQRLCHKLKIGIFQMISQSGSVLLSQPDKCEEQTMPQADNKNAP